MGQTVRESVLLDLLVGDITYQKPDLPEFTDEQQTENELEEVRNRMTELRSKLPAESERHGWIWLFLMKKI